MIKSLSACLLGGTLLLQAGVACAFTTEAVSDAETLLAATVERAKLGEVTATDVALAEVYLLDMKLEAGTIARGDYCARVLPHHRAALFGVTNESRVGARTVPDIINAQREMHRAQSRCSQK